MREQRIDATGQQHGSGGTGAKPPSIRSAAERNRSRQPNPKDLKQCSQRCGRTVEFQSAKEKLLCGEPVPLLARDADRVHRTAGVSLHGEAAREIDDGGDRNHAQRAQHRVRRAARTHKTSIDQRKSSYRQRNQQYQENAECHSHFRERGNRGGHQ